MTLCDWCDETATHYLLNRLSGRMWAGTTGEYWSRSPACPDHGAEYDSGFDAVARIEDCQSASDLAKVLNGVA